MLLAQSTSLDGAMSEGLGVIAKADAEARRIFSISGAFPNLLELNENTNEIFSSYRRAPRCGEY
jgi:hypothetical protein